MLRSERSFHNLFLNGVQKLASAVISPTKRKIGGAIFVWLFLLLDAGQLFHNLSINGVQSADLRY
ncbi:hydrolase [Enterococcus faecium]|nr:hydrolase [Enterococcus faecium]